MTTQSTRRCVLAGIAAVPAVSLPVLAPPTESDPIFALIEAHRAAHAEYDRAYREGITDEREADMTRLRYAAYDLAARLVSTLPTTVAGVGALLAYYAERTGENRWGSVFPTELPDVEGRERPFEYFLARSAAKAIDRIVAGKERARMQDQDSQCLPFEVAKVVTAGRTA